MFANMLSVASCLLVVTTTTPVTTNELILKSNLLHIADREINATTLVTKDIISQSSLLHTANHEVTRLGVLFGERSTDIIVFFIESDVNEEGERVDYGLYALTKDPKRSNHTVVTKLLDNARDIAVVYLKKAVYFAAKDGIYVYNKKKNSADKYGSINDEVISIAAENATGVLYYVNNQHQLYKVTKGGQKFTTVDEVKNAEQITVDYKGYLYYYTTNKKVYVYDGLNIKEVKGIPNNFSKVWLVRTPVLVQNSGFVNIDDQYYTICGVHATARVLSGSSGALVASAVSADMGLVMYYAADKKIYEFIL